MEGALYNQVLSKKTYEEKLKVEIFCKFQEKHVEKVKIKACTSLLSCKPAQWVKMRRELSVQPHEHLSQSQGSKSK